MCRRPTRSGTGIPRLARSPGSDISSSRSGSLVIDWESLTAKFRQVGKNGKNGRDETHATGAVVAIIPEKAT